MRGTAIQFGAGNIGRGFMGQLFSEAGLEVVFVDVNVEAIAALNDRKSYQIEIVGSGAHKILVPNVRAVSGLDVETVADEISRCEILCTAVGAGVLPHLANVIAAGLIRRFSKDEAPLNILLCENLHGAADLMRKAVGAAIPDSHRNKILDNTGFVQAVVSRMVPARNTADTDVLGVRVEAYKHLPVDGKAIVAPFPEIAGIEPVMDFEAQVERKLYTHNCAHAVLGYFGADAGYEFGWQALENPEIFSLLRAVTEETSAALVLRHGVDPAEQSAHVSDLIERFQNRDLGDTCRRLARDPIRKLQPDDRLVGSARLCESQSITPVATARAIAAALHYTDDQDPTAPQLQRQISEDGLDAVLQSICVIHADEPLALLVRNAFHSPSPKW